MKQLFLKFSLLSVIVFSISFKPIESQAAGEKPKTDKFDERLIWFAAIIVNWFMLFVAYYCYRNRVRRTKDLIYLVEGKPELINPNVPIHEQVNLLPYDSKYEFPKEKLVRGKRLGSGSFGCVEEAVAYGIIPQEKKTKVAVKMLNDQASEEDLRELLLELKILSHLGRHLNIIGLLGAVTKNILKRELCVIVEYCQFGSVKDFLVKHRRFFVDQINHTNDQIDFDYVGDCSDGSSRNIISSSSSSSLARSSTYIAVEDSNIAPYVFPSSSNYVDPAYERNSLDCETTVSVADIPPCIPLIELDSPLRPVSTLDLLLWSYQIARGMEYLASRNVMHGDVAARNILLGNGNVVKICDFGKARTLCGKDYYRKNPAHGRVKLPFKWVAPESYQTLVFTIPSDVWSFGVLLWELFSLGDEPYRGIDCCEDIFNRLNDGYRMPKPAKATERIYWIMSSCWNKEPMLRPKFDQLAQIFRDIIGADRTKHFDDLNASMLAAAE